MNNVKLSISINGNAAKSLRRDEMTFLPIDRMNYNYSKVFRDTNRFEEELLYGESIGWVYNEILYKIRQVCNVSNAKIYAQDLKGKLEESLSKFKIRHEVGRFNKLTEEGNVVVNLNRDVIEPDRSSIITHDDVSTMNQRSSLFDRSDDDFPFDANSTFMNDSYENPGNDSSDSSDSSDIGDDNDTLEDRYGYGLFKGGGITSANLLELPLYTFFSLLEALKVVEPSNYIYSSYLYVMDPMPTVRKVMEDSLENKSAQNLVFLQIIYHTFNCLKRIIDSDEAEYDDSHDCLLFETSDDYIDNAKLTRLGLEVNVDNADNIQQLVNLFNAAYSGAMSMTIVNELSPLVEVYEYENLPTVKRLGTIPAPVNVVDEHRDVDTDFIWHLGEVGGVNSKWQLYFNDDNDIYRWKLLSISGNINTGHNWKSDYNFGWHRYEDNDFHFVCFYDNDSSDDRANALFDIIAKAGLPDLKGKLIGGNMYYRPDYITTRFILSCEDMVSHGNINVDQIGALDRMVFDEFRYGIETMGENIKRNNPSLSDFVDCRLDGLNRAGNNMSDLATIYRQLRTLFVKNDDKWVFLQNERGERYIQQCENDAYLIDIFGGNSRKLFSWVVWLVIGLMMVVVCVVIVLCVVRMNKNNTNSNLSVGL